MRIDAKTQRGQAVSIIVDGAPAQAFLGESVAGALLASGRRAWRTTPQGEARGIFCGIGVCFDCAATVNGVPHTRACQTLVADGMVISSRPPTADS